MTLTDILAWHASPKQPEKPAEAEPKQRPDKRPSRPAYSVPRGVSFLDKHGDLVRYRAGSTIDHGIVPKDVADDYLKRGDLVALND